MKLWFYSNDHEPPHFHAKRRGQWEFKVLFLEAAEDMFEKTSTEDSPWSVVAANYKWYARLKVLKSLVEALEYAEMKKKN